MKDINRVSIVEKKGFGSSFVSTEFLHKEEDEFLFRFRQVPMDGYRKLTEDEVDKLKNNGNEASSWDDILVKDPFDPSLVKRNTFYGLCRLGPFEDRMLAFHDFYMPIGITDSTVISSDILSDCAVHHCHYISHYIIGKESIIYRVGELQTTNHAKFGVGVIKEGESEDLRVSISVMNEAGGREILPFVGMNTADAYIWAKYRDRKTLMKRLTTFTENTVPFRRGVYGIVGRHCVIKSCHIIKDVNFGPAAYVKGCNKLKNLTVDSSEEEPVQLGEGIELVNGIIGRGCRVFYGCKAIRFVMASHSNLKYGARLIHSYLGDNSTVSCCEVLNNLIFPFHEEHHNNSFLIASLVKGQSNMAAGATVGSNHNSRGNDGELCAGRGFWPALSTTLKHDSCFASFTLITKGNYPAELNIPLPFSMVTDNAQRGRREVMPAYWWMYNMYALARNSWKFSNRDRRIEKPVSIETDFLAPDTVNEIINAVSLMELWTGRSALEEENSDEYCRQYGRSLLKKGEKLRFEVFSDTIEHSPFPVRILKPVKAYAAYHDMLLFYGMKTVSKWANDHDLSAQDVLAKSHSSEIEPFENIGGQLVSSARLEKLLSDIEDGRINSWDEVHAEYRHLAEVYEEDRLRHAIAVLEYLAEDEMKSINDMLPIWDEKCTDLNVWIKKEAVHTKQKDYENEFRWVTYRNREEREAVLGGKITSVKFTLPHYDGFWKK